MGMKPKVVVDGLPQLQRAFADDFQTKAADALASHNRFVVGLPGGSVASAFFPVLATVATDWTRVDIFWIDERAVPPDHPDSNYGAAAKLLLTPAGVPASRVHRMPGEMPDLEQAAAYAAAELASLAGDPPLLDLVLAGVGDDGHVASIFGGHARRTGTHTVIAVHNSPKPPLRRLTLTLDVLARAGAVFIAAFGESKSLVMRDALENDRATTPVAELLRRAGSSVVLLDPEAGRLLRDADSLS
jgi:6-phosphogluconolactonase